MAFQFIKNSDTFKKLSGVFPNIYNLLLSKKQKELLDEVNSTKTPPVSGTQIGKGSPLPPPVDNTDIGKPTETDVTPPVDNTTKEEAYVPEGEGAGNRKSGSANTPYIPQSYNKDYTGVGQVLGLDYNANRVGDESSADHNTNLRNKILDYVNYASKFGKYGDPYKESAINLYYPLLYKQAKEYKFNKDSVIRNSDGTASMFDPTAGRFIPLLDEQNKPRQYVDVIGEEIKKPKLTPYRIPETGKLGFMDDSGNIVKQTDINYEDYNENPYKYDKLNQDMQELMLRLQSKGDGNGRGNGYGYGSDGDKLNVGEQQIFSIAQQFAQLKMALGNEWDDNAPEGSPKKQLQDQYTAYRNTLKNYGIQNPDDFSMGLLSLDAGNSKDAKKKRNNYINQYVANTNAKLEGRRKIAKDLNIAIDDDRLLDDNVLGPYISKYKHLLTEDQLKNYQQILLGK